MFNSDSDVLEKPKLSNSGGDHERFSHIVRKPQGVAMSAVDYVTWAMIEGVEVQALCGKKWVPSRDPKKFPVCPTCKEIVANME